MIEEEIFGTAEGEQALKDIRDLMVIFLRVARDGERWMAAGFIEKPAYLAWAAGDKRKIVRDEDEFKDAVFIPKQNQNKKSNGGNGNGAGAGAGAGGKIGANPKRGASESKAEPESRAQFRFDTKIPEGMKCLKCRGLVSEVPDCVRH
jgi:hypothetical protein